MKLKTKLPVTIAQAKQFEDEQGLKGIKKLNILSQEDCIWQLEVGDPTVRKGFSAQVKWYQIQAYDMGDGQTGEMAVLMFSENFAFDKQQFDDMFNQINISIIPPTSFADQFDIILEAGILLWVGTIRQIFGLGPEGFETITGSRPAPETGNSEINTES